MYGYIYKITNTVNGKFYIGQHKSNTFEDAYCGSGIKLRCAMKHYGKNAFSKTVLESCRDAQQLDEREQFWIASLDATNPDIGYNIALGGRGSYFTEKTKKKISKSLTGKHLSAEHRLSISRGNKGHIVTEDTRQKISKTLQGHSVSVDARLKISAAHKGRPGWNKGRHLTQEERSRLSEAAKHRVCHNICKKCGHTFDAKSPRARFCNDCKEVQE